MSKDDGFRSNEMSKLLEMWDNISRNLDEIVEIIQEDLYDNDESDRLKNIMVSFNQYYSNFILWPCFGEGDRSINIAALINNVHLNYKHLFWLILKCEGKKEYKEELFQLATSVFRTISKDNTWTKYTHPAVASLDTFRNQSTHPTREINSSEHFWLVITDPFYDKMAENYCNIYHMTATLTLVAYSLMEILATWAGYRSLDIPPEMKCYNIRDCRPVPSKNKDSNKENKTQERNPIPDSTDVGNRFRRVIMVRMHHDKHRIDPSYAVRS